MRWGLHWRSARLVVGRAIQLVGEIVAGERSPASATYEEFRRALEEGIDIPTSFTKAPRGERPTLDAEQIAAIENGAAVAPSAKAREMLEAGARPAPRPGPPDPGPVVVRKRQVAG